MDNRLESPHAAICPQASVKDMTNEAFMRLRPSKFSASVRTMGVQSMDWNSPFSAHIAIIRPNAPEKENARLHSAEPISPTDSRMRGRTRSTIAPKINCPLAYTMANTV